MMAVLDWRDGFFELTAGATTPVKPDLETSVTHLLLDHARRSDEAIR